MREFAVKVRAETEQCWDDAEVIGEVLVAHFQETNPDWYDLYFPFMWSFGDDPSDGRAGPPISNPLELHACLLDMAENAAVTRKYDLRKILLDHADSMTCGDHYEEAEKEWAEKTAQALESLAAEIRSYRRAPSGSA